MKFLKTIWKFLFEDSPYAKKDYVDIGVVVKGKKVNLPAPGQKQELIFTCPDCETDLVRISSNTFKCLKCNDYIAYSEVVPEIKNVKKEVISKKKYGLKRKKK